VAGLEMANQLILRRGYSETQAKLERIDAALMKFYKIHQRLPCASSYTANPGVEADTCVTPTYTPRYVIVGPVPYATLNIPYEDTIDAYGGKIVYAVSRELALDAATAPAGYFDNTPGNIEIRSGRLQQPCTTTCTVLADPQAASPTGAAYVLLSHGPDNRGAYNRQNIAIKDCSSNMATEVRIDAQNCWRNPTGTRVAVFAAVSAARKDALFYDSRYNASVSNNNYFDDIILWRTKGRIM